MVAATDCNDDDEKTGLLSRSKDIVSEDVQDADNSSQIHQEGSEQGIYDSDAGDSDCSVTSGLNVHPHERRAFFSEKQVGYITTDESGEDESGETTWTDEKHSSYLDSMEATFVQKMYDKEYCSIDVCGHSSTSSTTLDHDCVESQPFWLNIRKPFAWKNGGLLTFRAPTRPITPALMLTSPWIQHFKSQKKAPCQNARLQQKDAQHLHTKEVPKNPSRVNKYNGLTGHGSQLDDGSTYKKRDFASASEAAEGKKQKFQHFTLSHMDVLMEKQFNKEQRQKMGINKGSEDEDGDGMPAEHLKNCHEHREVVASCKNGTSSENHLLKEKQKLSTSSIDIEPPDGAFSRKPDQVVPSCKRMNEEASVKTPSADLDGVDKDTFCANMGKPDCVSNPSGSKTWTWNNQGARCRAINKSLSRSFC